MDDTHPLTGVDAISNDIEVHLGDVGEVFQSFRYQDSGNLCYGVRCGAERFFVKTAGPPQRRAFLDHDARCARLEQAQRLQSRFEHPALPRLRNAFDSPWGPVLVYEWAEGELLGGARPWRSDPRSAHQRFRALPVPEIVSALDAVYDVHLGLSALGVVAVDFYDSAILYDFATRRVHLCDLDEYREAPFTLEEERTFGSTRFMAPEEFVRGSRIDQVTNVFTLGRTALVFLSDGSDARDTWRGSERTWQVVQRACEPDRSRRHPSVRAFVDDWQAAR